jgi:D-sedoheptulose 7-phosphate isomerase
VARLACARRRPGGSRRLRAQAGTDAAERRRRAGAEFFGAEAERIARLCRQMAERFTRGGRLLAVGLTPAARSDARHVAVEFVHPVIVGKRALPALALGAPGDVELLAAAEDMVIGFDEGVDATLAAAEGRGCLALRFEPQVEDAFIRQEIVETTYHVLWELVHVFFEHLGKHEGGSGASSFLYPFLNGQGADLEPVVEDVRRSVLMKADEVADLRAQTLEEGHDELMAAAAGLRERFGRGGKLLALGNGGSATDAMDVVADLRAAALRAIDLSDDPAIITAIANDIGVPAIFSRQVIAYGDAGDALLALSTSGNSENVIDALAEARRRGLLTIAMVGYDGGRVAAEGLADHVVVTRSEHIPRIQEAQASAYHVLVEAVA